jgi:hypothetical protein
MKKIVFGSIFSAFLILSIAWLTPIHVKAAETEKEELKDALLDFVVTISEDQDYLDLLTDDELKQIGEQYLFSEDENEKEQYFQEFEDIIISKYQVLIDRYLPTFESLKELIENIFVDEDVLNKDKGKNSYFKLDVETDYFKITKQKDESISGSAILINGRDGSVKIPGQGWVDEDIWDTLLDFLRDLLFKITLAFEALIIFLEVIMLVFLILDILFGKGTDIFYLLNEHTMCIILFIMSIWFKVEIILMALIALILFISEFAAKPKAETKSSRLLEKISILIRLLQKRINLIFARQSYA